MMSKKGRKWIDILYNSSISHAFQEWLTDPRSSTTFQITSDIFSEVGLRPVEMIPHYQREKLPKVLVKNHLELFRNQSGGCVLTKTGKSREYSSLFPLFPPCQRVNITNLSPINYPSILFRNDFKSEVSIFFLTLRMGILEDFIFSYHLKRKNHPLESCGSMKGTLSDQIIIGKDTVSLDDVQVEIDHILENEEIIVVLELKKYFYQSMSLHQLFLPFLYLNKQHDDRVILPVYFMGEKNVTSRLLRVQLYSMEFTKVNGLYTTNAYRFVAAKEYLVKY